MKYEKESKYIVRIMEDDRHYHKRLVDCRFLWRGRRHLITSGQTELTMSSACWLVTVPAPFYLPRILLSAFIQLVVVGCCKIGAMAFMRCEYTLSIKACHSDLWARSKASEEGKKGMRGETNGVLSGGGRLSVCFMTSEGWSDSADRTDLLLYNIDANESQCCIWL